MSLLLEALKKAEKAKEEAQRRARSESADSGLRLEPTLAAAPPSAELKPEPKPVLTRAELPDIHKQPLEILSDDIPFKAEPAAKAPASAPAAKPDPQAVERAAARPEPQAAERAAAKKVFEAKFKEPNPRLPFYITLGFLAAFALGTVVYFWYQLRPPPALVNVNPPPAGDEAPPIPVAQGEPRAPAASAPIAAAPAIPGLPVAGVNPPPAAASESEPAAKPAPKPKPAPQRVAAAERRPASASRVAAAPPAAAETPPTQMSSAAPSAARPVARIDPKVESAYAAYLAGDFATARTDYQEALRTDGANRDALLGLAAIDMRSGRYESAEATYLRLLQLNPNDAHAQAGLIALRTGRLDPLATESRVKSMLAADPAAHVLHFTLGNQLARQGRWSEAQQEYFRAFAAAPNNADFAYNLAVSLDHVRQEKLALEYYQRAIALAGSGAASFDVAAARSRVAQLAK